MTKVRAKKILTEIGCTPDEISDLMTRALNHERPTLPDGRTLRYVGLTGQWEVNDAS